MDRVLIIDDDVNFASSLSTVVERQGYAVDCVNSFRDGQELLSKNLHDLVLVDLILPDGDGLGLVSTAPREHPGKFVVVTGNPSVETAVNALTDRVDDYLIKPLDSAKVRELLGKFRSPGNREQSGGHSRTPRMIGASPQMVRLVRDIDLLAKTNANVLIQGESGSGKELVAQLIHHQSERAGPFYAVNCGALRNSGESAAIFGTDIEDIDLVNASPTLGMLERAQHGTLFLDEVAAMPMEVQTQLLRVIDSGQYTRVSAKKEIITDIRIVASTNQKPSVAIENGDLREDLFYRLAELPVLVPPLRDRGSDIEKLALFFLDQLNLRYKKNKRFSSEMIDMIGHYDWPGNVRELHHVVHHAFITSDLELTIPEAFAERVETFNKEVQPVSQTTIAEMERRLIESTLKQYEGNKRQAAEALGISLKTLYNRLNQYNRPKHQRVVQPH